MKYFCFLLFAKICEFCEKKFIAFFAQNPNFSTLLKIFHDLLFPAAIPSSSANCNLQNLQKMKTLQKRSAETAF